MYRYLITLIVPILFCSNAYNQTIKQVGNGIFQIDRAYAEMIAQQLDSLNRCNELYMMSNQALNNCIQAVEGRDGTITVLKQKISVQDTNYKALQSVILHKDAQIGILETQAASLQGLVSKIDKKRKRGKFWGAVGGVLGGLGAGVLIGIIAK